MIVDNRISDLIERIQSPGKGAKKLKRQIMKFVREEDGLTTVEYAIAGGLIGSAVIAAFGFLGDEIARVLEAIGNVLAAVVV